MTDPKDWPDAPEPLDESAEEMVEEWEEDFEIDEEAYACLTGFERKLELGRLVTEPPAWAVERPDIAEKLVSAPNRVRLALTGGIASGKSTVAEMLMKLGAGHIDFDLLARRAVEPGTPGFEEAAALFGPEFITSAGTLDRPKIGRAVFSDPELKKKLEDIIHPRTWELMGDELEAMADMAAVVVSVPLLFEAGLESFFSPIILVFADAETQIERLLARNPELDRDGAESILANQWPAPPKVMGSSYVINNSGPPEETARQAEFVWRAITG